MILSGHQPCYLPSLQFFAKMAKSDVFMHCGHLQFQRRSWHHRNYIFLNGKRHLLSIPVHAQGLRTPIRDVWFDNPHWKKKHLETIALAYGKAPFFDDYYWTLKDIIYEYPHSLEILNINLIYAISLWLGIRIKIVDSAHWHFEGDATEKIIQMCEAVGADAYLSNEGARDYINECRLYKSGIRHTWLDFKDPDGEPFSAIHHLFMLGPEAARLIGET